MKRRREEEANNYNNNNDEEIIIIKIGGSSITNKAVEETLNQDAINWFASLISGCVHTSFLHHTSASSSSSSDGDNIEEEEKTTSSDTQQEGSSSSSRKKKKPKIVVIHGAGSFGHHSAKRYGLQCGKQAVLSGGASPHPDSSSNLQMSKRYQMEALSKTRHSVQKLNAAMVQTLLDYGVNAVGISPGVSIPGMRAYGSSSSSSSSSGGAAAMDLLCESIRQSLDAGLLPVIHGDACLLDDNDAGILGGDTLVEGLVGSSNNTKMKEHVRNVIFITDVAGVFSSDPKRNSNARLIRSLKVDMMTGEVAIDDNNSEEVGKMEIGGSSHAHDVTGGLKAKLGAAVTAVQCGKDVIIVQCCSTSAEKFVQGHDPSTVEEGTVITRKL